MERDYRRGKGQWKGCHAFRDILRDGKLPSKTRNGGLTMGSTYYYYVSNHIPTRRGLTTSSVLLLYKSYNILPGLREANAYQVRARRYSGSSRRDNAFYSCVSILARADSQLPGRASAEKSPSTQRLSELYAYHRLSSPRPRG